MLISIDPGKNVGVATFDLATGEDHKKTVYTLNFFPTFLHGVYDFATKNDKEIVFLYEDFNLRQDKALNQTGSDMPASQAIGMVKQVHTMLKDRSRLETCKPSELRTALKWAGYDDLANKPRTYHCPDDIAAYAHGVMWLIRQDIRKHPIFES